MNPAVWMTLLVVGSLLGPVTAFIDPLSLTVAAGAGSILYGGYKYYGCSYYECCDNTWIPADFNLLESKLKEYVYGQHLVNNIVLKALRGHFNNKKPRKALTLSFHGWPGVGKNYVSQMIMDSLYKSGSRSSYVHAFMGRLHFPMESKSDIYKLHLTDWIRGNVSKCERSMFVFDEVDKMPRGVLDAIKPFIDYHEQIDNIDYRKAVFIFLSNTGGNLITDHCLGHWKEGKLRSDLTHRDFEDLIRMGAFNEKGGFHRSETIESNLIDHYVPFLPLEQQHVRLCIIQEFQPFGIHPSDTQIDEVMKDMTFGPEPSNYFANSGCKRISQKVVTVIEKIYTKFD